MNGSSPWVAQVFERDRKFERFRSALEEIASRGSDLNELAPDLAFAAFREVIGIARRALNR